MTSAFYFNIYAVPQFLVGFFMLAQGLVVLAQDRRSSLNRAFFLFELAVFVWLIAMGLAYMSVGEELGWFFSKIGFIGVTFIPITTYAFSLYYGGASRQKPILIGGLLFTILLVLGLNFEIFTSGVYKYTWGYYIKLGLIGALPFLMFVIFVPLFCVNFYIKIIIGRTVGYIFLTTLIVLFYTSVMLLVFGIDNNQTGKIIVEALIFAGSLYIMSGLKEKTQRLVDQLLFKERIQLTQLTGEFIDSSSNLRTTKILAEFLLTFVVDKLRANSCALYIFDKNGGVW